MSEWRILKRDPDGTVTYFLELPDSYVIKTETPVDDLLAANAEEMADSQGKRWGDGQRIGSVPLDLYYASGLDEAMKQRDRRFIKRFWNDGDNAKFRTFRGQI